MSKEFLEPSGDYLLAVDTPHQETTVDGITLPDNERQKEMMFGTVVFIGPMVSVCTKVEDRICYGPYAGKIVVFNGVAFRSLREEQIEFYVRKSQ